MSAADVDYDPYEYDDDPYDTRKERCACGHTGTWHAKDGCVQTVVRVDTSTLPVPDYGGVPIECLPEPINWPPPDQRPTVTVPCGCKRFGYPEQDPSDYGH